MATCTQFSSFNLDVYILLVAWLITVLIMFACCCLSSDPSVHSDTLPSTEPKSEDKAPPPANLLCGTELLCGRKGNSCGEQASSRHPHFAVSVVLRIVVAFVIALLVTWILLAVIFAALETSLMYPAELDTDCTVCTGDIATITFEDANAAASRSPYCCDYSPSQYLNVAAQGFVETSAGDSVNWWFIPGNSSYGSSRRTILYNHGSGRLLATAFRLQRYHYLASIGVNVVTFDYAGYGKSTVSGSLSDESAVRSAKAMVEMLVDGTTLPQANISSASELLVLGRSMGTGVALQMVEDGSEFRGVLLQSPFSTYAEAVGEYIATALSQWLVIGIAGVDTLDNVNNVEELTAPLYESMSTGDDFIPFQQAEEVFAAAVNVPAAEKDFVEYTCDAHDYDLSSTEKSAILTWVNQFR